MDEILSDSVRRRQEAMEKAKSERLHSKRRARNKKQAVSECALTKGCCCEKVLQSKTCDLILHCEIMQRQLTTKHKQEKEKFSWNETCSCCCSGAFHFSFYWERRYQRNM